MFSLSWCSINWKITWPSQWLPFLAKRMRIQQIEKLVANLHDKT